MSNELQWTLAGVLGDGEFLDRYFLENEARLLAAYELLQDALTAAGLPFVPAVAGIFVWVDLRQLLEAPTWEAERAAWQALFDRQRVVLTPGEARAPCLIILHRQNLRPTLSALLCGAD